MMNVASRGTPAGWMLNTNKPKHHKDDQQKHAAGGRKLDEYRPK